MPLQPRLLPLTLSVSLALFSTDTSAAIITVKDGADAGIASTCTLRQAIESANNDAHGASSCESGSGADTIVFASALVNSTITLGGVQLDVTSPLTINGSGQTIDANYASRVMYVRYGTLTASDLNFTNGVAPGNAGGGIALDGGSLTLTRATISGNSAGFGAGIYAGNLSVVALSNSVVADNTASVEGGGIEIETGTAATLSDSAVSGNMAQRGGGVLVFLGGTVAITRSSVSGNTVSGGTTPSGGGVYGSQCASLQFTDSTVSGNTGDHQGAGIIAYNCPLAMVNATVTGNTSTARAGGLYVEYGSATLINSTISGNTARDGGGIVVYKASLTLSNTIASANSASNAAFANTKDLEQRIASTVTLQYSLLGSALNVASFNGAGNHNVFSDAPGLGTLEDNGGATQTMALTNGSPAIDKGSNALALAAGIPLQYDQRAPAWLRLFNGKVDIGAFEYQGDRIFGGIFESAP